MLTDSKISDIVHKRFSKMRDICTPVFDQKQYNRALYAGSYYPPTSEDQYSLTDPQIFPMVRNYLSRSNPSHTQIRLDPRNEAQYESRKVNQAIINWELSELSSTDIFYLIYYSGFMNGKGYFETSWLYEPAVTIEESDGKEKVRTVLMRELSDRATASYVPFESILIPDPNILRIRQQPYYGREMNIKIGSMLDLNESLLGKGKEAYWDEKWLKKARDGGLKKEVLDYQMDFADDNNEDLKKEDMAFRAATVAVEMMQTDGGDIFYRTKTDGDVINTKRENEYWHGHYPIADFSPFPEDDSFFPMSLVDVVGDLQISASELLNLGMSNIRQSTFQMYIAGSGAAQTPSWQFRTRPNGIIKVLGDPSQLVPFGSKDTSASTMRMAQEVSNRIEKASGVSSLYASGASGGGTQVNQTARGAQIIDQNIDTNLRMITDLFGENVIKVLGEDFLELNAQYITEKQTFVLTGKKGVSEVVKISPEQVSANFTVSVNAERMIKQTPASKQASIQNTITVLENIQNQSGGAVQIDLVPPIQALIDATPEMEEVGDVVISIDEKANRDIAMLMRGQMPEIKVRDPHLELIQMASIHVENHQMLPQQEMIFQDYVMKHIQFLQSAKEVGQTVNEVSQADNPQPVGAPGMEQAMNLGMSPGMNEQQGLPDEGYNLDTIAGAQWT